MSNNKGKVVITGGSGFLGINLAQTLIEEGYDVCIISRNPSKTQGRWKHVYWDGRSLGGWADELNGAVAIVNLAGRSVDCIKTPDNCDAILRSRVESTLVIGEALRLCKDAPSVWVQMSTAHIYGDPMDIVCTEETQFGYGLAVTVGKEWEKAFEKSVLPTMRRVVLRTSFVIGKTGGALPRLAWITKLGLGGKAGSGKQGMSWIHEVDMNRIFMKGIEDKEMNGVYIATAPNPVSNEEFMRELRGALRVPIGLPALAWMVKIGAPLIMNTDPELALYGRYCIPKRLLDEGFKFQYETIRSALCDACA